MDIKQFIIDHPVIRYENDQPVTVKPARNRNDNMVHRGFHHVNRYFFDTRLAGWKQYDTNQDAWYFGVWVNIPDRMILTYAEGDVTLVTCEDNDHLRRELESMAEFYGPPPPAFISYDFSDDNKVTRTEVFDERPAV